MSSSPNNLPQQATPLIGREEELVEIGRLLSKPACRLVEGMPLAIELAAAWANLLSCPEIAAEIEQGLDLLENEMSDLPERHHSIRAVFDYSWDLMRETERDAFIRLSLFRGGFFRESAQAVAGANLRTLMSLLNKSLIRRDVDSGRYDIHQLLRQYGQTKLEESGQRVSAEDAYAAYFVRFMADRLGDLKGSRQLQAADQITIEWDNVAESVDSAWVWNPVNFDRVRQSIEATYLFAELKNRLGDIRNILELIQDRLSPDVINESNPAWQMANLRFLLSDDYESRLSIVEKILELVTVRNDLAEMAFCYRQQGVCIINLDDDREQASAIFQKAYQLYEEMGDDYGRVESLFNLASATWNTPDEQIELLMQALKISEHLNNPLLMIYTNKALASTYSYGKGDNLTAEPYLKRAIEMARQIGASHEVISCQVTLGWMATNSGNFDKARSCAQRCIENNQDLYGYYERWHPTVQMAIVKSVADEDYEAGLRLARQAHGWGRATDGLTVSSWGISFPLIGMARYQEAAPYIRRWLDWSAGMRQVGAIASFALILGSTGRHEWCTELLGLCENNSMAGWKDKWSVTHDVIGKAKAELGEEGYQAAFERGKSLDLETVVQELLDEFGEDG